MNHQEAEELIDQGFHPVQPKNPKIRTLLDHRARYIPLSEIDTHGLFCKWCCDRPIMSARHKYCSTACTLSAEIYCYPQRYWAREYLKKRDGNKCNLCHLDFKDRKWARDEAGLVRTMEVDHIIPIHKGGTALGTENLQLLCNVCHIKKSVEERRKK